MYTSTRSTANGGRPMRRLTSQQSRDNIAYAVLLAVLTITAFSVILVRTHNIVNEEHARVAEMPTHSPNVYAPPRPQPARDPIVPVIRPGDDNNENTGENDGDEGAVDAIVASEERRAAVKAAMKHAWGGYKKYAWGNDELSPLSKAGTNWLGLGATIIDSLDTLWIMGMKSEFNEARDWVRYQFNPAVDINVSFFETTIRILGGLLSAYALSGDEIFLGKARDLGDRLIRAVDPENALPYPLINLKTGVGSVSDTNNGHLSLAEVGTVQLEFLYLSELTGDSSYGEKALQITDLIWEQNKDRKGLIPTCLRIKNGRSCSGSVKLGGAGDSYYEYLLKLYFFLGGKASSMARRYRTMFNIAMNSFLDSLTQTSSPSGLTYVAEYEHGRTVHKMEHLVCFAGGALALAGAKAFDEQNAGYISTGKEITRTCHEFYTRMPSGLAPEMVTFSNGRDFRATQKHNLLRPETVESYFVLWRLTHEQKYRDWGWEMFRAFEKHCKTQAGYASLDDVTLSHPNKVSSMPSYFLAETLKYFYLLYSEDDVISLDDYVFNTEAHPFPVNKNNVYN